MKKKILLPYRKYRHCISVLIVLVSILFGQQAQVQEEEEPLEERVRNMKEYLQAKAKAKALAEESALRLVEAGKVKDLQELLTKHIFFTNKQKVNYLSKAITIDMAKKEQTRPGRSYKDCADCPQMVVVPAGEFRMGDLDGSGLDRELPVHRVTISRPFAVSKYAITFAQWDACVEAGGCKHRPKDHGWGRCQRPVINVSWDDITKQYIPWLNKKTGNKRYGRYRLLTEAEWEYVARAGTKTKYSWGDDIGKNNANYCADCTGDEDKDKTARQSKKTAPVGSFAANKFGLYDMHGNVWEWLQDCWNGSYEGAPTDGRAWQTGDCSQAVVRGGSWYNRGWTLRASIRAGNLRTIRDGGNGFRLAQDL